MEWIKGRTGRRRWSESMMFAVGQPDQPASVEGRPAPYLGSLLYLYFICSLVLSLLLAEVCS